MISIGFEQVIGYIAAFCTTFALLPQTLQVIRTRSTRDISCGMYGMFTVGLALWILYGIFRHDFPLIIANIISFGFSCTILFLKATAKKQ